VIDGLDGFSCWIKNSGLKDLTYGALFCREGGGINFLQNVHKILPEYSAGHLLKLNQNYNKTAQHQKMMIFYGIDCTQ